MTPDETAALREWIADRETYVMPRLGDAVIARTPDGPVIEQADQRIGVSLELAEDSTEGLRFAVENEGELRGVLTIKAINRTVRYRVLSFVVPQNVLVCDRINEA